ncbi:MAG: sn-glycerol-3-phosphate ABC transporter ATP-binding protein UgpC [Pseudomonadota bacterium]
MASVHLKAIHKQYANGLPIVKGVDLEIADGEFIVFVGPSGCGKSTLLRMIAGLEDISAGELHIGGKLANHIAPAKRGLAMVFQSYALYPHMSVFENMAFSLRLAGQKGAALDQAVKRAADILQIGELLQRKPKDLSGGQRQRVAIGRAIVRQPAVFLFDEPLSNLDASLRVQMRLELSRLHRQLQTTMIYVTHDQVEAMTLGQRIVVLNGGRIEQVGTPEQLYNRPGNLFVAGFLGAPRMNLVSGRVASGDAGTLGVRLADGSVITVAVDGSAARSGDPVTLGIRAENMQLLADGEADRDNMLTLDVNHAEYLGDQTIAYARLPQQSELIALRQPPGGTPLHQGSKIRAVVPPSRSHAFDASGLAYLHPVTIQYANQASS